MYENECLNLGIDIGSTTAKAVLIDGQGSVVFSRYRRHNTDIKATLETILAEAYREYDSVPLRVSITGSGGLQLAQQLGIDFVQEVIASKTAVERFLPGSDVAIELGGEDAKIIYFTQGLEQRMNGTCAGGTGAFIDQMAILLGTDAAGLNELAKEARAIYPIASRCGVFAKSDVQPLLNEGARREDIAASIFQAVVNQTIAGLACGRPIRGNVVFLGGPLQYLSELKKRFIDTLESQVDSFSEPANAHLYVALGAALQSKNTQQAMTIEDIRSRLKSIEDAPSEKTNTLDPLFKTEEEMQLFKERHAAGRLKEADLNAYVGPAYLGIDAGSTTFKVVLIDPSGHILYSHYAKNKGDVIDSAIDELLMLYRAIPRMSTGEPAITIAHATVTGYGEALLKAALGIDSGEVETIAHLKAAQALVPDVDFILDIGGQDMKCLSVRDGIIDHIQLNEACSAGCGSFIETFAESLGFDAASFAKKALSAKHPVDLGSRCTVFMNSCVKQAQKEGAGIEDIAAGLAYSVVKNALFKVIKVRDPHALGKRIVVQGGTFLNDAVLRAFELTCDREVLRPEQAGIMGAYGAAVLASERATEGSCSSILNECDLGELSIEHRMRRCKGCSNSCLLTINEFSLQNGKRQRFVTGNRCEKGDGVNKRSDLPNLLNYKYERLFAYTPLEEGEATRPTVGIPRALNMYENYPFWFTFFTCLGFRVVLSDHSSKELLESGMESMPSESVCFPAKLAHGHVIDLLAKGVDFIFMPCIRHERQEDKKAKNCFNCPIVSSYPEALKLNIPELAEQGVPFVDPYLPYRSKKRLSERMEEELTALFANHPRWGAAPTSKEIDHAIQLAWKEDERFKLDIHNKGKETLDWMKKTNTRGIVLAGRPYHADPMVNHAIPELINGLGFAVLTEDAVSWMGSCERDIRAFDQWMYHSRLYAAAKFVTETKNLSLVQLNSFGCGLDAVTTDQVQEIIEGSNDVYTCLKIDEVSNLGAVRIRIRSLMAALDERVDEAPHPQSTAFPKARFTKKMKKDRYTIIAPQMSPIHFELLEAAIRGEGYDLHVLPADDKKAIEAGLKYVNNDICYPSILTTGQAMAAVESGEYDLDRTAILMVQTGGGCRASNYISLIRKALKESGHSNVPVISLSFKDMGERNSGWNYSFGFVEHAYYALVLGDILMQCLYRTRPYEAEEGSADRLFRSWMDRLVEMLPDAKYSAYIESCKDIIRDFDALPLVADGSKPRVGIVGEILVKYHPTANNDLVGLLEREGCEVSVPGFTDFFQYAMLNTESYNRYLDGSSIAAKAGNLGYNAITYFREEALGALRKSHRFHPPAPIRNLAEKTKDILQLCNCMGEGWLLTAEMIELIENKIPNIVICSPFACLPNHVVGKAVMREMKVRYPESNIVAVDYDPGASVVNQLNRIKLMLSVAKEKVCGTQTETSVIRDAFVEDSSSSAVPATVLGASGA